MPQESTLSRDRLTDAVIRAIQEMILRGEARPGDWLMPQPELAQRLGVGLSTVREAIKGLTLLGVLEPQPGRGTWVHAEAPALLRMLNLLRLRLPEVDLHAIYEARRLLEVELTVLAAERADERAVARIDEALQQMRQALQYDEAFMEADLNFHLAVARAAGNPLLEQFYHVTAQMMSEVNRQIAAIPGLKDTGLRLQEEILQAIRTHDTWQARQRALALVGRWREVLEAFESIQSEAEAGG